MVDERYIAKRIRELRKNANMDAIRKTAIELLNLLARPVGLEPTTYGLEVRCSIR